MIDTKAIRVNLMTARRKEKPTIDTDFGYYDGVVDALFEIDKILTVESQNREVAH